MLTIRLAFDSAVFLDKLVAISPNKGSIAERARKDATQKGMLIDLTEGRKCRCLLFTTSGHVILSNLNPHIVYNRAEGIS